MGAVRARVGPLEILRLTVEEGISRIEKNGLSESDIKRHHNNLEVLREGLPEFKKTVLDIESGRSFVAGGYAALLETLKAMDELERPPKPKMDNGKRRGKPKHG